MSMRKMKHVLLALAAGLPVALSAPSFADFEADSSRRLEVRAENAIARMQDKIDRSRPYFEDAYAIVVWPGITRVGFGFGGAYGKGVVIEQDEAVGTVGYWQFSSGIQAGLKNMTLVLFFKDRESLESLKRGEMQFVGQAGVDFGIAGAHGTPTYNEGVAIIPMTNLGLMGEFAAAGVKYTYRPY
jgi:lipid-binding SYLF domain-containing protein